jgi:hypothetical protein
LGIGLSFFQILALFKNIRVAWPSVLVLVFDGASISNLNLGVVQAECTLSISYFEKLHLVMASPCLLWLFIVLVHALAGVKRGKDFVLRASGAYLIFIHQVSFIGVVHKALGVFNCATNPDGSYLLQDDPDVSCRSQEWLLWYALPAVFWLSLYTILSAALLLWLSRTRHDIFAGGSFVNQTWSALFRKYKRESMAFELVVLARKFMPVGSIVLLQLYPMRAISMFLVTVALALLLNTKIQPYEAIE